MNKSEQIKIEEVSYDYLGEGLPRPQGGFRRFQQGKNRFYYTVDKTTGKVELFSSATTLIKDGYAEDKIALEEWRNRLRAEGKDPSKELNYAADRGTIMHTLASFYIQGVEINLNELDILIADRAPDLLDLPYYEEVMSKDTEWLQKALLAFGAFVKEYNVKPLALELIMKSDKYKVASPIDLIATMEIEVDGLSDTEVYKSGARKGQPKEIKVKKEILAIIDLKSSQSGFYDSHYLQLQLYKRIFEENYPNLKVDALFNWSPKDWRSNPSFNLKLQSDEDCLLGKLADVVYQQGMIKHQHKTPMVKEVVGTISRKDFKGDNFVSIPLVEYLEKLHKK